MWLIWNRRHILFHSSSFVHGKAMLQYLSSRTWVEQQNQRNNTQYIIHQTDHTRFSSSLNIWESALPLLVFFIDWRYFNVVHKMMHRIIYNMMVLLVWPTSPTPVAMPPSLPMQDNGWQFHCHYIMAWAAQLGFC